MLIKRSPDTDMASEQLMVHSEETEAAAAEELEIPPDCALASLHVEACILLAYTALSPRKYTNLFTLHTPNSATA